MFRLSRRVSGVHVCGRNERAADASAALRRRRALVVALTVFASGLAPGAGVSVARSADAYDAAVAQPKRTADDRKRDAVDHPAEILRLAGIRPGMKVADILAADGYYSELLSYLVGPRGHVLLLNNAAYEKWSEGSWAKRLANGRLPNVEHRTAELEGMQLGDGTLDAVLLIKVYHDFYWTEPNSGWPPVDVPKVLDAIAHAVKRGGVLLLVDHSAVAGTGSADAGRIHRVDEQYARHEFESRGFVLDSTSNVLRHPEDQRDQITYKGAMVGKTDRFVMVFRKK
jgi:predicted methyltransferase